MTDPVVVPRCKHGAEVEGAYQCPDCTDPQEEDKLSGNERMHRWYRWAQAVAQPLGVGATDEGMRQSVVFHLTKAQQEEIASLQALRAYVQHKPDCPRSLPNLVLDLGPGWTQSVSYAKPCSCGLAAMEAAR